LCGRLLAARSGGGHPRFEQISPYCERAREDHIYAHSDPGQRGALSCTSARHQARTVSLDALNDTERLVKSVERVRDLGEVFTPADTVAVMLDLLPDELWQVHPSRTFLEPACGDGNFLIAILDRKLTGVTDTYEAAALAAGSDTEALAFHALGALASIYAVDISVDNVIGGTPGHEVGARDRMLAHLERWHAEMAGAHLSNRSPLWRAARWVVDRNIQVGNMLDFGPDGRPSGRDQLPLVEYRWNPSTRTVKLFSTTLGAVMDATAAETSDALTLFGPPEPTEVWEGKALRITDAPIPAPVPRVTHTSNGRR
jgi:hypothetical protein